MPSRDEFEVDLNDEESVAAAQLSPVPASPVPPGHETNVLSYAAGPTSATHISDFLSERDYTNYRNVRAASLLFIAVGFILAVGGAAMLAEDLKAGHGKPADVLDYLIPIAGVCGALGGFAALLGRPRWSRLAYVMAVLYLLVFPIGTIISLAILRGLPRYLKDVNSFRNRHKPAAA